MLKVLKYEFIVSETDEVKKVAVPKKYLNRLKDMKLPIKIQCGSETGSLQRVTTS